MLVEIENLTTGYAREPVFENVSLTFAGGVAALVGPNGAGKTTLLRTLLGFLPFRYGRVKVCGHVLPAEALQIRAKIGYMPEGDAIIGGLSAVEFVTFLAELSGLPRRIAVERAHSALNYVGLGEARYRALETFSAGMKQRVKLAQAIVHDPQLLLLDEPTDGMDPSGRKEILELLRELASQKGMSMIICSHLLDDVEQIARDIILINQGKIISRKLVWSGAASEEMFALRVHGDPHIFARRLAEKGVKVLGPPQGAELRVALPSRENTTNLFLAAQESDCVLLRVEPLEKKAADVVMELFEEGTHANL
ncbi:MAG: ABC transporter ATP-binding protein [Candidatus Sumerlaeaceae bacterium]